MVSDINSITFKKDADEVEMARFLAELIKQGITFVSVTDVNYYSITLTGY